MLPRTAALALGMALLSGCQGSAVEEPDPRSGCPAVEIVGVRGQGQSLDANGGLGGEVRKISEALADEAASSGTVRTTAIRHVSRLGSWDQYVEDVRDGRDRLSSHLRSVVTRCPDASIAVIGFSQGAQIAREELAERPGLAKHVDVLVLVGSPHHEPSSPFVRVPLAGGEPTGSGSRAPGPDLGDLSTRTVEACVSGDPVCTGAGDFDVHRTAYEDQGAVRAVANAAAEILQR